MKLVKDQFADVQELGRKDAECEQDHADDYVVMKHGQRPVVRPSVSLEHALWLRDSDPTRLDRWVDELDAVEHELVQHQPRWLLWLLLIVVFLIEGESGILYWKDQGVTGTTRLVMAAATAATTIFLPWILVELANQWRKQP